MPVKLSAALRKKKKKQSSARALETRINVRCATGADLLPSVNSIDLRPSDCRSFAFESSVARDIAASVFGPIDLTIAANLVLSILASSLARFSSSSSIADWCEISADCRAFSSANSASARICVAFAFSSACRTDASPSIIDAAARA